MARALALIALAACSPRVPPAPELPAWDWVVDRAALPDLTLRVAHVASMSASAHQAVAHGPHDRIDFPATVAVLTHPTQGIALVDTGLSADVAGFTMQSGARLLHLERGAPIATLLPGIGAAPADVRNAFLTHLHWDHADGLADFPAATLWTDAAEWDRATAGRDPLHGYDPARYTANPTHFVHFGGTPPYGPFPHHVDAFGDGSVVLLPCAGHTPGSLCVLVNRPTGSTLFLGDAAWVDANWQEPAPKGWIPRAVEEHDWRAGMEVLWRIRAWHERFPELVIVPGHETANRQRFPEWPATAP